MLETAISGTDHAVPASDRDYVARIRAAGSARDKLALYAGAIVRIQSRLAPVYLAIRDAAATDPDSAALWAEINDRRAANMRDFAADLRATGELRRDLSDDEVADIVWGMNGAEYWVLMVDDRGWSHQRFGEFLADAWARLLLANPSSYQLLYPTQS